MRDEPREVDRRLDPRIAAADHRDTLALEQRAVAVRTISDALVAIFGLAGDAHLAPARAGRQDHRLALHARAAFPLPFVQTCRPAGTQLGGVLHIHTVDPIILNMRFDLVRKLRSLGDPTSAESGTSV